MNNAQLLGRLTAEPNITYSNTAEGQLAIARFRLAVNRVKKDEADFISCIAFGKRAEVIEKYVTKGNRLLVIGHIQTGSYQNKDGQTVYTTEVVADRLELIESKSNNSQPEPTPQDGFIDVPDNVDDSGLPFNFGW